MLTLVLALCCVVATVAGCSAPTNPPATGPDLETTPGFAGDAALAQAFAEHATNLAGEGSGTVSKLLPDDTDGDRHQRFIVQLASGQTLLIAHNIDAASRVESLDVGDAVHFKGVYEWNEQGGVIHWTHHDPARNHAAGWIKHNGRTYQ